jgi:hypothetical protein
VERQVHRDDARDWHAIVASMAVIFLCVSNRMSPLVMQTVLLSAIFSQVYLRTAFRQTCCTRVTVLHRGFATTVLSTHHSPRTRSKASAKQMACL